MGIISGVNEGDAATPAIFQWLRTAIRKRRHIMAWTRHGRGHVESGGLGDPRLAVYFAPRPLVMPLLIQR